MSSQVSIEKPTNTVVSSDPLHTTVSSPLLREVAVTCTSLTIDAQTTFTNLINEPRVCILRSIFSSILLKSVRLEVSTGCLLSQVVDPEPIFFGFVGARSVGLDGEAVVELPYLSRIVLSNQALVVAISTIFPPGLDFDLGRLATAAGHPTVVFSTNGEVLGTVVTPEQPGPPVVSAVRTNPTLLDGTVYLTFEVSGVGSGVCYDL